jgi:transposase-like protein
LQRLGVHQQLWRTLSSTNPIESMISICRSTSRNVKRWQNGDMCLRWTAAGMLEAESQFRKIIGYQHLAATRAQTISPTTTTATTEPGATLAAAH